MRSVNSGVRVVNCTVNSCRAARIGRLVGTRLLRAVLTLVLAGLGAAALLRIAPGASVDERNTDPRISRQTLEILRREHEERSNFISFSANYFAGLLRAEAGHSDVYNRRVADLIAERAGTTVHAVATGFAAGFLAAILLAAAAATVNKTVLSLVGVSLGGALLSTPSALLAITCLVVGLPPWAAIAAVVFPRILPHALAQFRSALRAPHVGMARARGVSSVRLFSTLR